MGRQGLAVGAAVATEAGVFVLLARWQRFLEVSGRCNEQTRRAYRRAVCNFLADIYADERWTGPRDPFRLTEDDAVAYLHRWTPERGPMRGQILRALRSFYAFCEDRDEIERSPFRHLRPDRPRYDDAPYLEPAELRRLLNAADQVDPRARWAMQLQYALGIRVGTLVALTWSDVGDGHVTITDEKPMRRRDLPLEGLALEAMRELRLLDGYVPRRGKRRPTVIGVGYERYRQWCKASGERAGVEVWTHLLRHTRATDLKRARIDEHTMVAVFGWSDRRMLDRYGRAHEPHVREAVALPIPVD